MILSPDVEERIATVETRIGDIDAQILWLRKEREEVLRSDEEYADYLDDCDHEPLSIRAYYQKMAELDGMNEEIMAADGEEFERLWSKYGDRIARLERLLCA